MGSVGVLHRYDGRFDVGGLRGVCTSVDDAEIKKVSEDLKARGVRFSNGIPLWSASLFDDGGETEVSLGVVIGSKRGAAPHSVSRALRSEI